MGDDAKILVIDNGSDTIKAGFAGEKRPGCVFPSLSGRLNVVRVRASDREAQETYIGREALAKRAILTKTGTIWHGNLTSWDTLEKIWGHIFRRELRVDPIDHPVLMTGPPLNSEFSRRLMVQIQFEKFGVSAFYLAIRGVMSMYTSGQTTGVTLEVGDETTQIVPVYEGISIQRATRVLSFGGDDVATWLAKLLGKTNSHVFAGYDIIRRVKENLSYVALDFESERPKETAYPAPSGDKIMISDELVRGPELLFKPSLDGVERHDGIHRELFSSITACDTREVDLRNDMYANIVLAGGTTMLSGFPERIEKEVSAHAPRGTKIKVVAAPERMFAAWIGGSIFGSLSTFPEMAITREEYYETGAGIVRNRFL
jgi:actin beta/gamma 1